MDQAKLVKSKSSHPSLPDKEKMETSKSNAELKTAPVKKRGVYVEKQEMDDPPRPKAPRRSKPGSKKFLASVLTILSKSNTGTQYPPETPDEATEPKTPKRPNKPSTTKISKSPTPKIPSKTDIKNTKNSDQVKKPKKQKYRSRVLNALNSNEPDKTVVLKCKQDINIIQTPSTYSKSTKGNVSNQSIKWADFLPKLIDSETGTIKTPQKNLELIDERVAKCVLEGTQINMQKELNEPTTLVSAPEKDEKLYNIFVNLLETVYNDKPDDDADAASSVKTATAKSSKVHFEIEDAVAAKLYAPLENRENIDIASKVTKPYDPNRYDDKYERNKRQLGEYYFNSMPVTVKWSGHQLRERKPMRNVKKKPKQEPWYAKPTTQSEVMPQRRSYKKTKKNNLLTVLKQELSVDRYESEEPDNFFQALRLLAMNKRRNQKSINFDVPTKDEDKEYDTGCRLKRRKVISPSKQEPKPYRAQTKYNREFRDFSPRTQYQDLPIHCYANSESAYSLEVYGFDYEEKRPTTVSDYSDVETVSEYDGVARINNWNRGFKTITQVWKQ